MIRSVSLKFIAFVLAACFLVCSLASLIGVAALGQAGLYDRTPGEIEYDRWEANAMSIGQVCVQNYASIVLGGCTEEMMHAAFGDLNSLAEGNWNVQISDAQHPSSSYTGTANYAISFELEIETFYYRPASEADTKTVLVHSATENDGPSVTYDLVRCTTPIYKVIVQLSPSYCADAEWEMMEQLYSSRYWMIAMAVVSLLLFAAFFVYLCCVAGRSPNSAAVRASGLNRLPLDLYTALLTILGGLVTEAAIQLLDWSYNGSVQNSTLIIAVSATTVLSLLVLAFFFSLAAQLKTRDGFWWKNLLLVRTLRLLGHILHGCVRLLCLLPVLWQWLLITAIPGGALILLVLFADQQGPGYGYFIWVALFLLMVPVLYGGYCFGVLLQGLRRMGKGDLSHKISTRFLLGSYLELGQRLNSLSETAMLAAENQVRSERMKTELITNVSHDIKTPLTSIINYADLLSKTHTAEEEAQYLDVLSRQSLRLKRLIEDLIELSKASSGSLPVTLTALDAAEMVRQALGEFSEKFSGVGLIPIFDLPEHPVFIRADGRLVWRVLSNLLGNAVKYAMPGTRLYLDVTQSKEWVSLSIKNISAQRLSATADELLERFIRGDTARNTEGSGLGLNIAQSLMEVQGGQLVLKVDGDLFKVTLLFPHAEMV